MNLKLYEVDFDPMWPVPSGLIILAPNMERAREIANETILHTKPRHIKELPMVEGVVLYLSGEY
jgi:hypothetical protein